MTNTEKPSRQSVAERSVKLLGIKKPDTKITKEIIKESDNQTDNSIPIQEAYDLYAEKIDLNEDIVIRERALMEPQRENLTWNQYREGLRVVEASIEAQSKISLEEKRALIKSGRINILVASDGKDKVSEEAIKKSQAKVNEIDQRLDEIFKIPENYHRFQQDLTHQIELRRKAREVVNLDKFSETSGLLALRLARVAQVKGRQLTSTEKQIIEDNQTLASEAGQRRRDLLQDPEVFDQSRLLQLLEYRWQLHQTRGMFVETPTRREYIAILERLWADGQKVLATGATGTGKTELVRFARNQMFGFEYAGDKYELTGHKEMTPYELLGRTGFKMQGGEGGDLYRPSKLIAAMTAKDGNGNLTGAPFLYDEIDASPNEANIALKTILNDGPGNAVSVQMDSSEKFVIGPNYSFTATANVKSEKHTTRFEIDPAIVRVLEPMVINYLPSWEVWDIAIASQMDRRGKVNFSHEDAAVTLKALCDAAYWTQQAYRGEKVMTGKSAFLEARSGATTGKGALLREGVFDPGRLVRILKGWEAARTEGRDLRDFLNEQIVRFINNENYPEDDRYYLTEIFALQGFLKGVKAEELLVPKLTQKVLDAWNGTGGTRKDKRKQQVQDGSKSSYLSALEVARLDPYKRLKRPSTEEARELLEEAEGETNTAESTESPDIERARELLGTDFLGVEAVEKAFDITLDSAIIPEIPFSLEDLEAAQGKERLILTIGERPDGVPLSMEQMAVMMQAKFTQDGKGKILYDPSWYKDENFFKKDKPQLRWRLVTKDLIPNSTSKNYLGQTEAIADYLRNTAYAGRSLPQEYEEAIAEFEAQKATIEPIISSEWKRAATMLAKLKLNQLTRQSPAEVIYDSIVVLQNNDERTLEGKYTWTNWQTSDGLLVDVGGIDPEGAFVNLRRPDYARGLVGVVLSR